MTTFFSMFLFCFLKQKRFFIYFITIVFISSKCVDPCQEWPWKVKFKTSPKVKDIIQLNIMLHIISTALARYINWCYLYYWVLSRRLVLHQNFSSLNMTIRWIRVEGIGQIMVMNYFLTIIKWDDEYLQAHMRNNILPLFCYARQNASTDTHNDILKPSWNLTWGQCQLMIWVGHDWQN